MAEFFDEFSRQAASYTQFRPTYPKALYEFLNSVVRGHDEAWDAGTGNGQSAVALAEYFSHVHASDPSAEQIRHAKPHERVRYFLGTAEQSGLEAKSVDLITVAQAAHWFDFSRFVPEVKRVSRPGGIVALWGYAFHHDSDPVLDALLQEIGQHILADYWPPQPKLLWDNYNGLPFPFRQIAAPAIQMDVSWTLAELVGYWSSWSAAQKFIAQNGYHPVRDIYDRLVQAWGDAEKKRTLSCPLVLKVGAVD